MDIFLLYQCRNFPVTFRCLSSMENKSNGLSGRTPDGQSNGLAPKQQPQSSGKSNGLRLDSNGLSGWTVQWTTQTPLLRFCILFSPLGGIYCLESIIIIILSNPKFGNTQIGPPWFKRRRVTHFFPPPLSTPTTTILPRRHR